VQKGKRQKFGKQKTRILEQWIKSHEKFSYPNSDELDILTSKSGLTEKQIRVWFTNYRNVSTLLLISI
jgi:hypothetical protein